MRQGDTLKLDRCPHCGIASPYLRREWGPAQSSDSEGSNQSHWSTYRCGSCGRFVLVTSPFDGKKQQEVEGIWPEIASISEVIPARARDFLAQAMASQHAPAGAVMLTASAVDSMLKEKGYKDGSLYSRIDAAATSHLITKEMAAWAHEIRLDANDQRHADEKASLPSATDAKKAIEFASALAQFLFVLPARVERGRKS